MYIDHGCNYGRRSSGVAKGGLTTGIIGTSLGALALMGNGAGLLGNVLGANNGWGNNNGVGQAFLDGVMMQALAQGGCNGGWNARTGYNTGCCNEDHYVTRYDAEKDAEIAKLKADIALRDANTYQDQKMLEMYKYVDGRMRDIEGQICAQAVINEKLSGTIAMNKAEQECCCEKNKTAIEAEAAARCCGDNAIVNYANATFYPQQIADITTAATSTRQATWNPIGNCGCTCNQQRP